jgi:putative oxidoreductase
MQIAIDGLRLICGLFFVPHLVGKFTHRDAAFGFFSKAGFKPAQPFLYAAMAIEVVVAVLLILGIQTRGASLAAATYLLIAAAAVIKVEKAWLWHLRGCEYPLFWGLCCCLLAWVG